MALKDILVHVDDSRACRTRIEAAVTLARKHDAKIIGIHVVDIPVLPAYADVPLPAEVHEVQRKSFAEAARRAEKIWAEVTAKAGLGAEWRCEEGALTATLSLHARYVDLLVLGQVDADDPRSVSAGLADAVVLECGRPVLVVPHGGAGKTIGDVVLVAWNAKREAVRAVSDAMPILERASRVVVLTVNARAEDPDNEGIPAADICLHLARHGIETEAENVFGAPAAVGQLVLEHAARVGADLLVMGAYGHSRLRELVLGGVTAHVLEHAEIPALLGH
ncbi:MAG: universal stress protein [Gammaproteobacteria bacterium]|nr:universal stress protein [Gammaproteobacteria bacterium]